MTTVELESVPESAAAARAAVVDLLRGTPHEVQSDTAALLVSELVTNALLHARTSIHVSVHVDADVLRVEVRDGSRAVPQQRDYSLSSGTGRGLHLVERLSRAWGTEVLGDGKVVWFELVPGVDVSPWGEFDLDAVGEL